MSNIINISGYKFVELDDVDVLRTKFLPYCKELELKGSILLSTEGINLYLAGTEEAMDQFIKTLYQDNRFTDMHLRKSDSSFYPFRKMLVKIRPSLLPVNCDRNEMDSHASAYVTPKEFKKMLDTRSDMLVLDARNDYEVDYGTFEGAMDLNIGAFSDFEAKLSELDPALKNKTVVTFCTGGIRCEKAAPILKKHGFKEVYQLQYGILNYLDQIGSQHFVGDCFVFDDRVVVKAS